MCICVKLNPLFDNETTVYYVTQVLMHSININKICSNYILEFRNTNSHVLQVYLGVWVRIEIGIEKHVCYIDSHCYYSFQTLFKYILFHAR